MASNPVQILFPYLKQMVDGHGLFPRTIALER